MARMWVVLGDATSTGGRVITGSAETVIDGKPVARAGDKATCPAHKGTFSIVDGDPATIIDGQPVALHGSKLACGCTVLATQQARVFMAVGPGAKRASSQAMSSCAHAADTRLAETLDEQFHLVHQGTDFPVALTPYRILTSTGQVIEGMTDEDGYTQRIQTKTSEVLSIEVMETIRGTHSGDMDVAD